jgi:hypothetical protein
LAGKAIMSIRQRLIDRYLFFWKIHCLWRDRKLIIKNKILNIQTWFTIKKIEREIKKYSTTHKKNQVEIKRLENKLFDGDSQNAL